MYGNIQWGNVNLIFFSEIVNLIELKRIIMNIHKYHIELPHKIFIFYVDWKSKMATTKGKILNGPLYYWNFY